MSETDAARGPGPVWAWTTAWSLQGAMALLAGWLWPEPGWQQFSLMGLGAGLPLAALYVYLRRRGKSRGEA